MNRLPINSEPNNSGFPNLLNINDIDFKMSVLCYYDNLLPALSSPSTFAPLAFSKELDEKKQEIANYVKSLDIQDIANQYVLRLRLGHWRVGGNRDGYDKPYLSVEVSEDIRRDEFITTYLPSHVSTDEYLDNNAYHYYVWDRKNEIDNYLHGIQQRIVQSFLDKYTVDQHISYLLYNYVYREFNREHSKLTRNIENVLKKSHLRTWILTYFMS